MLMGKKIFDIILESVILITYKKDRKYMKIKIKGAKQCQTYIKMLQN